MLTTIRLPIMIRTLTAKGRLSSKFKYLGYNQFDKTILKKSTPNTISQKLNKFYETKLTITNI